MDWINGPTCLIDIPDDCEYLLMVDESGQSSNFKNIKNKIENNIELTDSEKALCLTGVVISVDEYLDNLKEKFNKLKEEYWENGVWYNPKYKINEKVHFHSTDISNIKNRRNCMRNLNDLEMEFFVDDLSKAIESIDFKVISICLDNKKLVERYRNPYDNYQFATELLLERFSYFLNRRKAKGIVVFESRAKADNKQLDKCIKVLTQGTYFESPKTFQRINGIYFNPKRPLGDRLESYVGIELVDLVSHPIFKMFVAKLKGSTYSGRDWQKIEKKLDRYPDYIGYGLKIMPSKTKKPPIISK